MTKADLDLCYLSASDVLARFKTRSLSPVEYLENLAKRTEEVEPKINAFTATHFDKAMEEAKRAETRYANEASDLRPLEGLPVAMKDEVDLVGERVTHGSLYYKDNISTETQFAAQRLLDAGAFYHAQTTTPEFCCAGTTDTRLHGTTRTPWGLDYTCGGSSGGSGASLAAGTTPLATGSDIGGSIRIPAACCGVVGFKPPYGRNPDNTAFAYDMYAVVGPMGRTVEDVALMQNIMCGPHPLDNATIRPKYQLPLQHEGLKGLKIAWSMDLGFFEIDEHVRANTLQTLDMLKDLGAELVEVDLAWTTRAERATMVYLDHLFGGYMASVVEADPSLATNWASYCVKANRGTTSIEFYDAYEAQMEMGRVFGAMLEECYAFICPTLGHHEIAADQNPEDPLMINGKSVDPMYGWTLCHPFNMLGRCPVLSVPTGIGGNGLPTSVQIVARHLDDERVFRVGQQLQNHSFTLNYHEFKPDF
ncbi:Acylamidase [Roseovarius albus]|uniref:Acylamidase n=1 Tax=Roseovarius albus TaxID=1247867 RepID=A0A1X6ZLL9_9RHOB|nr:amidase [Roseovarius albus]SLN54834.1 Acylamidase [Roseovarius albus]